MGGKKLWISLAVAVIGLLVYLFFASSSEDFSGGGSFFGSSGAFFSNELSEGQRVNENYQDVARNTRDKKKIPIETLPQAKEKLNTSSSKLLNSKTKGKDGEDLVNSSLNLRQSLIIQGDSLSSSSSKKKTTFNIGDEEEKKKSLKEASGGGGGGGTGALLFDGGRKLASKSDDDAQNSLFTACLKLVESILPQKNLTTESIRQQLLTLQGFNLIDHTLQTSLANDIQTQKYGNNPTAYCNDITSSISDASIVGSDEYAKCTSALEEILKANLIFGTPITENLILSKLSLMEEFSGATTTEGIQNIAQEKLGSQYNGFIEKVQTLTHENFANVSSEICSYLLVFLNEKDGNSVKDCIAKMNEAKFQEELVDVADIVPNFNSFSPTRQGYIQSLYDNFLVRDETSAQDLCMIIFAETNENEDEDRENLSFELPQGDDFNQDNAFDDSNIDDSKKESIIHSCVELVDAISLEFEQSRSNPRADFAANVVDKIAPFEFFIPAEIQSQILEETLLKYLSLPQVGASGNITHRDVNLFMKDENFALFSSLSGHEKITISNRLYELDKFLYNGASHISNPQVTGEIYPNLCKCSHADFSDNLWTGTVNKYSENRKLSFVTQSLPQDIFERNTIIASSDIYQKCVNNGVATLTTNDTTTQQIFAKISGSLPEMADLDFDHTDMDPLRCYATDCAGQSSCSLECEDAIDYVCSHISAKHLESVPQQKLLPVSQIFQCPATNSSYNLIHIYCFEGAENNYQSESNRVVFLDHCKTSIENLLNAKKDDIGSINVTTVDEYLSQKSSTNYTVYVNQTESMKQNIANSLFNAISTGNISYDNVLEKSCYNFNDAQKEQLSQHFLAGMSYFMQDAQRIRREIVEDLWKQNEESMAMKNIPITFEACIAKSLEKWSQLIAAEYQRIDLSEVDLALPPSSQCKCYLQQNFLMLHNIQVKTVEQCQDISAQLQGKLAAMLALAQSDASVLPSNPVMRTLNSLPKNDRISFSIKQQIAGAIIGNLGTQRVANLSIESSSVKLIPSQIDTHCNYISSNFTNFTAQERKQCLNALQTLTYDDTTGGGTNANMICQMFGKSLQDTALDDVQMNAIAEDNAQLTDFRLSTCTQKLRSVYMQIKSLQAMYWTDYDYDYTLEKECSTVTN